VTGVEAKTERPRAVASRLRPRPRPDLFEAEAKAKATIFCPEAVLDVDDSSL